MLLRLPSARTLPPQSPISLPRPSCPGRRRGEWTLGHPYPDGSPAVKNRIRQGRHDRLGTQRHDILGWPEARADPTSGIQRLVSYPVKSTPSGNVRVSTKLRFTQWFRAVKNGVPPPTRTGWGDDRVLVDQPGPHGRPGEGGA